MKRIASPAPAIFATFCFAAIGCGLHARDDSAATSKAPAGSAAGTSTEETTWLPLDRDVANTPALLPAGLCGLDGYLREPCDGVPSPHYAVLLPAADNVVAVENALREAATLDLAAGYPFATTFDEMPARDASRRGLAVVAGLFAQQEDAARYREHLPRGAELVELASEPRPYDPEATRVVTMAERAPAWSSEDLGNLEHDLDEALAKHWIGLAKQRDRRLAALAKLTPRCFVAQGRTFLARHKQFSAFRGNYATVSCADGREAWVEWRATRLESVVTRSGGVAHVHQVVLVDCDVPVIETRRWGTHVVAKPLPVALHGAC